MDKYRHRFHQPITATHPRRSLLKHPAELLLTILSALAIVSTLPPPAVARPKRAARADLSSPATCVSAYINSLNLAFDYSNPGNVANILTNNPNIEGNDYAAIYTDATSGCGSTALAALTRKLQFIISYAGSGGTVPDFLSGSPVHPLRTWLAGAPISLLFASALALDQTGFTVSDTLLTQARDAFQVIPVPQDVGCGVPTNSCMDDYAVTSSGFGWIAAYEKYKGRTTSAQTFAALAQQAISNSFRPMSQSQGSICYYVVGSNPVNCGGSPTGLLDGTVKIVGANHNQENPPYGLGMMSIIADACNGLANAGHPCAFTPDQKLIAMDLLQEAQQKSSLDGSAFLPGACVNFADPTQALVDCSDSSIGQGGYLPTDFPIKRFFDNLGIGPVFCGAYPFDHFTDLRISPDRSAFFGLLREVSWETLGFLQWLELGVPCAQYQGYHELSSCPTISGWAWDATRPDTPTNVDLYDNKVFLTTIPANLYRSDLPGNHYHAFVYTVPTILKDGNTHSVTIEFSATNVNLTWTPRSFSCPVPAALSLNPATVTGGSANSVGTVTLTTPAPAGGLPVILSSSNPAVATVPSSVTVFGSSGTFTVSTSAVAGVTPVTIRASAGAITKTATLSVLPAAPVYQGYFEDVYCQYVQGWAKNANFPNTPITVDILADGVLVANFLADIFRPDGGIGSHGFFFPLPVTLRDGRSHSFIVRFGGTTTVLPPLGHTTVTCNNAEQALALDIHSSGYSTNLNGVFEPGETVQVEPSWKNTSSLPLTLAGTINSISGPLGATYTITDPSANYGTIPAELIKDCYSATGDCYKLTISNPTTRPASHWDALAEETFGSGNGKAWIFHVGRSFTDVPTTHKFYLSVETIFHKGITAGCTTTTYCPDSSLTRAQMAVFLLKEEHGASYVPPPAVGIFTDVPPGSFAADWIEQLYREGITVGCGGGNYCPNNLITRDQMAVFLLKIEHGSGYVPPPAQGNVFTDVPATAFAAAFIEQLSREGGVAIGSCSGAGTTSGNYCPLDPTTRGQAAEFLTKTFHLKLYGP